MSKTYLFSVNPDTRPTKTVDSGDVIDIEVEGAFVDVEDIQSVPTPFTPESEGHPLAPIAGPIKVNGAKPGDSLIIELLKLTPTGIGTNAIVRNFGVLKAEFPDPAIISCPVRNGKAWFGDRIPIPLFPNLGTISTMPPEGYKPSYAGPYGGDFDQKDVAVGAKVHLPVMVPDALLFMADPHAVISDGIISGTGVECTTQVSAKIELVKESAVNRPILDHAGTIQILGFGETVEAATRDASNASVKFLSKNTDLNDKEAYMLLGIIGELRIGTSPRPIMAARLIIPKEIMIDAGWTGKVT